MTASPPDASPGEDLPRLGAAGALAGAVLAVLAVPGPGPLLAGVLVAQLLLVAAVLERLGAPGRRGALLLAVVAAVTGDAVVLATGDAGGLAGVVALALVAGLLHQLLRRGGRPAVTVSLAATLLAVVTVAATACLLALREEPGSGRVTAAAVLAGAAALLAGRLTDRFASRRPGLAGGRRGLPGLLAALAAGALAGAAVGGSARAAVLGLAAGLAAAVGDLVVVAGEPAPEPTLRARDRVALLHAGALLPYALLAPVALVAGRWVLG